MRLIDADALKEMKFSGGMRDDDWIIHVPLREVMKNIEEAPTIGGWISVKDRLPDEKLNPYTHDYQEVICFLNTRIGCDVRAYKFGRGHFLHDGLEIDKYITHWMPLPEPPKEVTGDAL